MIFAAPGNSTTRNMMKIIKPFSFQVPFAEGHRDEHIPCLVSHEKHWPAFPTILINLNSENSLRCHLSFDLPTSKKITNLSRHWQSQSSDFFLVYTQKLSPLIIPSTLLLDVGHNYNTNKMKKDINLYSSDHLFILIF